METAKVVPAGPGIQLPAGQGRGHWRTYNVTDGLAGLDVRSIFWNKSGHKCWEEKHQQKSHMKIKIILILTEIWIIVQKEDLSLAMTDIKIAGAILQFS